ncbi:MAG: phytanoyl-CoA dioxygenase family protein [Alphaproteobacteria bacterium]|jgi:phytanoyl-CoA hydroxylase|nr:phytanoyl-CoA dioxygenase family protein [Rhodospirillaceae bacterium]MBT7647656.1 phytanoyl-CoA dioxygenase family protein [Rhodospirillaceae bacterium]MDG2479551.1 phytanoyl-CoA dioxygenase family protein [Alphaproteobacteria bacterium]
MNHRLSRQDLEHFHDEGYLVVEDVLSVADLALVWAEFEAVLDAAADRLHAEGRIPERFATLPFAERYAAIAALCPRIYEFLDITLPVVEDMPGDAAINAGPAIFGLLTNTRVLDVIEDVLGPEITSNPTQHLRLKLPGARTNTEGATSWHQDLAGLLDEALSSDILTVWMALTDATVENGCLQVIPGSHRFHGEHLTRHVIDQPGGANYIPADALAPAKPVPLPVARGGLVLFHKLTHHASLPNRSDSLRMSLDLRYQPTGQPTGRPAFPSFVVRSQAAPETVITNAEAWAAMWETSKQTILRGEHPKPIYETARWTNSSSRISSAVLYASNNEKNHFE